MPGRLCIAFALLVLSGCVSAPPVDSGIQGSVTAGPSCPVQRLDAPCPDLPYAATLSILSPDGRKVITSVVADASGYYRVLLPAGSYIIHPESPSVMPHGLEVLVVVQPHQFTRQDIQYDTGIR